MRAATLAIYPASMRQTTHEPIADGASGARTYLVEHYWPGITTEACRSAIARLRSTSREMVRGGAAIRCLHSTIVPADEAAFCVFAAPSADLIELLYARAGIGFDRIVAALDVCASTTRFR